MKSDTSNFYIRVYDNYHYMDESEAYNHGSFSTYDEALIAAKEYVHEFFESNWKPNMDPGELMGLYSMYGDDPVIIPNEPVTNKWFSAATYARENYVDICQKLENINKNKPQQSQPPYKING